MRVELLYIEGCPHRHTVDRRLSDLQGEIGFELSRKVISNVSDAERLGFKGSPTILIDGSDPFASQGQPVGLACRIYQTPGGPAGSPTTEQLKEALS